MSHNTENPYGKAVGAYDKQKQESPDQRQLESHLLLKSTGELQKLYDRWDDATSQDIDDILTYNRKLWMVFFDTALENPDDRPKALRENILSLCNFIFKRTVAILAEPEREKLLVLIDINREVAAGLQQSEAASAQKQSSGEQAQQKPTDQTEEKSPPPSGNFTTSV